MGYQGLGKLVARRHALLSGQVAARILTIRKTKAPTGKSGLSDLVVQGSSHPNTTRRPARISCFGPRIRHSSACVPQHKPSLAQRSATRIGGWMSVTWIRRVLRGDDKRDWSESPVVKLLGPVAECGCWRKPPMQRPDQVKQTTIRQGCVTSCKAA